MSRLQRHSKKIQVLKSPHNNSDVYYYKRNGEKYEGITNMYQRTKWIEDFEDETIRFVAQTKMHKGKSLVSTIWLGYESAYLVEAGNAPRIFETIVFVNNEAVAEIRDTTEEAAKATHRKLVNTWNKDYIPFVLKLFQLKNKIVNFILRR